MKRIVFAAALAFGIAYAASATPIDMSTTTGVYTQTFDSLIRLGNTTWTDDSTLSGWYAQRTGTGTSLLASNGVANAGGLYSFGISTTATDRALGSLGSGNATAGSFAWGVQLRNTSGFTITNLSLAYWGEQWRYGTAAVQILSNSYQTASSPITALAPSSDTGWTLNPSGNFSSPTIVGPGTALDGNVASNRTFITSSISLTLANNDYVMIRWRDVDHTGTDHSLAIDEVGIAWTAIPEPTTVAMLGLFPVVAVLRRVLRRREP